MPKKKLQLLPEVLPDPRPARSVTGGPRTRTLDHLQKLLAASAVAAIGCGGSGGSSSGYAVVDPMPMPPPRCFDPNGRVKATAAFVTVDGKPNLRVRVEVLPNVTDVELGTLKLPDGRGGEREVPHDPRSVVAEFPVDPTTTYTTFSIALTHCVDVPTAGWLRVSMRWPVGNVDERTKVDTFVAAEGLFPWEQEQQNKEPPKPEPGFAQPPPGKQ